MPKITNSILVFSFALLLLWPGNTRGDALYEVLTGPPNSASWQFTKDLSIIWQQKYQDTKIFFEPRHNPKFYDRFVKLNNQQCKAIIAPLKSITELPITEMEIKIVSVLWDSYLVPIDTISTTEQIGVESIQDWLIPEHSLIIPHFTNRLAQSYIDSSSDVQPDTVNFLKSFDFLPNLNALGDSTGDTNNEGFFEMQDPSSTEMTALPSIKRRLIPLSQDQLNNITSLEFNGFLFYEMLGPSKTLENLLPASFKIKSLNDQFIAKLLRNVWFINPFNISRLGVNTVGVTWALYVHEMEDPEFVTNLIELLNEHPKSYFPQAYLLKNLNVRETKEISPLFLHQSSIEFFNID